ncbi:sulfite exporter TauE/SafE family protein [Arcanobacterium haemolyticum]|nr:sulfite exporter TauE/SafE family protein [Arcanobacterium haemolyticum]
MIVTASLVGLAIGIVVGALGAGGGILSVPALVYLLGQNPHDSAAGSLIIVGLTAAISIISPAKRRNVRWRDGAIFGALSVIGSAVGSRLSVAISSRTLMLTFGVLLIGVGIIMLRRGLHVRHGNGANESRPVGILGLVAAATLTGLLTGFFGVGGGFAVVPMLVIALGFTMTEASATSLLVMLFASAAGLIARLGTDVTIPWHVVLPFAVASMLGGLLGGPLTQRVPNWILTTIFGALLLAVAVATIAGAW